jgi:hypothetical protein
LQVYTIRIMAAPTYLTVLTFVGLVVGLIGGLIAQVTKTSVDVDGTAKKRLTSSGRLAIVISLIGFAGSFASELLKASIAAQQDRDSQNAKKEEAIWKERSTNLTAQILMNTTSALDGILKTRFESERRFHTILSDSLMRETRLFGRLSAAGTPLTSMTVKLILEHVPISIIDAVQKGMTDAESSAENSELYRELDEQRYSLNNDDFWMLRQSEMDKKVIQPFITLLARDQFLSAQGILVFGLDKRLSAIAGVGWVRALENEKRVLPSGVLIGGQIEWCPSVHCSQPQRNRPEVSIDIVKDSIVLSLYLGLTSLDDGLFRYSQKAATLAALSDDVEFISWSPSDGAVKEDETFYKLPFDDAKVNPNVVPVEFRKDQAWIGKKPMWMRRMKLQIIPNGAEQISKTYHLTLSAGGYPEELDNEDEFGYVRIWHGHAN